MPVKIVGRPSVYLGKHLLWLLGNLKDFGVGRVVTRHIYERYPEPTFYIIRKVKPYMDDQNIWGDVWAEQVFRGRKLNGVPLVQSSDKPDWRLVPREEEHKYLNYPIITDPPKVLPRYLEFPPLLKKLVEREMKSRKRDLSQEFKMKAVYRVPDTGTYRIAEEGEEPTVKFNYPNLLPHLKKGVTDI